MTKLSHRRILLLLLITPILLFLELAIGFGVFSSIQNINKAEKKSTKLDTYLRANGRAVSMAESSQRGYLLTGDIKYRDSFTVCRTELVKNEEYYDTLDNDVKTTAISKIQQLSARKFDEMARTISLYDSGMKDSALALVKTGTGKLIMDSLRGASRNIRAQITDQITLERSRETRLFIFFFALIAVLILFNIFLVQYTYRKFVGYTRELETMVNSLEQANERMSTYTSMSYHELKTPLRSIHGFAQLLKVKYIDQNSDKEQEEFIHYITDGIKQMDQTIDGMRTKYLDNSVNDKDKLS